MVVGQLVERLLPIPEICSLYPVIGQFDFVSIVLKRRKEAVNG